MCHGTDGDDDGPTLQGLNQRRLALPRDVRPTRERPRRLPALKAAGRAATALLDGDVGPRSIRAQSARRLNVSVRCSNAAATARRIAAVEDLLLRERVAGYLQDSRPGRRRRGRRRRRHAIGRGRPNRQRCLDRTDRAKRIACATGLLALHRPVQQGRVARPIEAGRDSGRQRQLGGRSRVRRSRVRRACTVQGEPPSSLFSSFTYA
jgi:hypothetical protein